MQELALSQLSMSTNTGGRHAQLLILGLPTHEGTQSALNTCRHTCWMKHAKCSYMPSSQCIQKDAYPVQNTQLSTYEALFINEETCQILNTCKYMQTHFQLLERANTRRCTLCCWYVQAYAHTCSTLSAWKTRKIYFHCFQLTKN